MSEQTNESVRGALALPDNANLEWLRKQAKHQLTALRATQSDAKLADAQFALAKSYGFPSWRALKAHVDALTIEGRLIAAARSGDLDTLRHVLDAHRELINVRTKPYAWTLLHVAAQAGHLAVVEELLARGLPVDALEKGDDTTPLYWAAAAGRVEVVERLVAAGANVNASGDDHALGVIGWATCWDGCDDDVHHAIVAFLIEHGARHHIFSAIAFELADEVRRIVDADPTQLDRRMSTFENKQTPLQFALRSHHRNMVHLLLELGADPFATDGEGMPTAVYANSPDDDRDVMRAILDAAPTHAFDAPHRLQTFVASLSLGDWSRAEQMLSARPSLINEGALHLMAKRGNVDAVRWLIEHDADPNALWGHWDAVLPAIHLAAWQGHTDIVRLLLDAGADPLIRDSKHDGDAAGWAEHGDHPEIVVLLNTR